MRKCCLVMLIGLLCVEAVGQSASGATVSGTPNNTSSTKSTPNAIELPPGVRITVRLGKSLSSNKAKVGDQLEAKVTEDLFVNGFVVVKKGSKMIGHVNFTVPYSHGVSSELQLVFDQIILKDSGGIPFHGFLDKVIPPNDPSFDPSYPDPTVTSDDPLSEPSRSRRRPPLPVVTKRPQASAPGVRHGSVIAADNQNVHLDSGTKLVLQTTF